MLGADHCAVGATPVPVRLTVCGLPLASSATAREDRPRIVALGDSLTSGRGIGEADAYPAVLQGRLEDAGYNYQVVNAGVSGDTSAGGLSRLQWALDGDVRVLVVALGGNDALRGLPVDELRQNLSRIIEAAQARKVIVILAGTNDIAGNTGPMTLEQTEDNLASMADLAAMNHIRVVLCSILPAFDYSWKPGLTPAPKIVALNTWAKAYAAEKGYVYVDFHSAMKDERDGLPAAVSADGVHPLPAGYAVMAPLVEAGIAKALTAGVRDQGSEIR